MNCIKCGIHFTKRPLQRTNPVGQPNAGWMCEPCLKKNEPELHKNAVDDKSIEIANIVNKWKSDNF